jgi:hypothetical protein
VVSWVSIPFRALMYICISVATTTAINYPTLPRYNILSFNTICPSWISMQIETTNTSKILVPSYQPAQCHRPQNCNLALQFLRIYKPLEIYFLSMHESERYHTNTLSMYPHKKNATCVGGLPASLLWYCNLNASTFLTYLAWVNHGLFKNAE